MCGDLCPARPCFCCCFLPPRRPLGKQRDSDDPRLMFEVILKLVIHSEYHDNGKVTLLGSYYS